MNKTRNTYRRMVLSAFAVLIIFTLSSCDGASSTQTNVSKVSTTVIRKESTPTIEAEVNKPKKKVIIKLVPYFHSVVMQDEPARTLGTHPELRRRAPRPDQQPGLTPAPM